MKIAVLTEATRPFQRKVLDPALMTFDEYHDYLNPEGKSHSSESYLVTREKLSSYIRYEDYKIQMNRRLIQGQYYDLRQQAKRYWDDEYKFPKYANKEDVNPIRDENGNVVYLNAEEKQAAGIKEYERSFAIFDQQKQTVASAENEWGCWLFMVAVELRGLGLGVWLGKIAREAIPTRKSGGFTPAGFTNLMRIHEQMVREYLQSGFYSWLVRSGQISASRVRQIVDSVNHAKRGYEETKADYAKHGLEYPTRYTRDDVR